MADESLNDRMKKFENAIDPAITKFIPKRGEEKPSVDMLLAEWEEHLKRMTELQHQLREAWNTIAQNALAITNTITK